MSGPSTGVVVMAYGTPASPDDVEAYYTHIRRGRPPEPEQLADLTAATRRSAASRPWPSAPRPSSPRSRPRSTTPSRDGSCVALGQKHAAPFIEDAVAQLAAAGVDRIVGLVLAPHYSGFSVGQYQERAGAASESAGLPFAGVEEWWAEDTFLEHQAASLRERLDGSDAPTQVLFTAHSLPERVLQGDPYPDQLTASAQRIADTAGVGPHAWVIGWQSAGRTPEPWRGPDILEVLRELAAGGAVRRVVVCPTGSPPTTSRSSTTSTSRPPAWPTSSASPSPGPTWSTTAPDVMASLAARIRALAP